MSLLSLTTRILACLRAGAPGPVADDRRRRAGDAGQRDEPGGELCDWRCAGRPPRGRPRPSASAASADPRWTACKAGTSKDMRDNWCIGWSRRYTVGVWIGSASGATPAIVGGLRRGAGVAQHLHGGARHLMNVQLRTPAMPPGVEALCRSACSPGNLEPAREEVFHDAQVLPMTPRPCGRRAAVEWRAGHRRSPADSTIFALDPRSSARCAARSGSTADGLTGPDRARGRAGSIDGKPLARRLGSFGSVAAVAEAGIAWSWSDAAGKVVDDIGVEVRGASDARGRAQPLHRCGAHGGERWRAALARVIDERLLALGGISAARHGGQWGMPSGQSVTTSVAPDAQRLHPARRNAAAAAAPAVSRTGPGRCGYCSLSCAAVPPWRRRALRAAAARRAARGERRGALLVMRTRGGDAW